MPQHTNSVHFSRLLRKRGGEIRSAAQNTEKFSPFHLSRSAGRPHTSSGGPSPTGILRSIFEISSSRREFCSVEEHVNHQILPGISAARFTRTLIAPPKK